MITRDQVYRSRYLAGQVKRYHAWPTITTQTVAAHCWRVVSIYFEIFGPPDKLDIIYWALHHDSGELRSGDPPYLSKGLVPGLREKIKEAEKIGLRDLDIKLPEISKLEEDKIKICDLLEMHEFGEMEFNLGNKYAEAVMRDTMLAAQNLAAELCCSEKVNRWLMDRGSRA